VIRYSYLWNMEHLRGQEEGEKDRPCAVILLNKDDRGSNVVTVLPITHQPPSFSEEAWAIEIADETKRGLGLDDDRSWIMLTEANRFTWPGSDLCRDMGGESENVAYGMLPDAFFEQVRLGFLAAMKSRSTRVIRRT